MKMLMLTVGLALICGLQSLNNNLGDLSKVTGEWFTVALASNVTSKIEKGGSLEIFIKNVSENNGDLTGVFFRRKNAKCIQFSRTSFRGDDGQLYVQYDGLNEFSLQSVDTKHSMYIFHNFNNEKVITWAQLFGRTPDLSDEIKKKFEEMCKRFGIRKDQIRYLSNDVGSPLTSDNITESPEGYASLATFSWVKITSGCEFFTFVPSSILHSRFLRPANMDDEIFYWLSVLSKLLEDFISFPALHPHMQNYCL
ncbi:trichosurin-like [Dromiciops gliroides]|uniref:trichosurin-like n=1 Tax=Dromiciops gliroides TaxID=33562 RepID=UPI001CC7ABE6|nr:trichosurin-like [Dromiciops gliroides]